jgi:hypothetical protein
VSTTYDAPREQEQIVGVVSGIVQKGPDKWQAVVQPDGSQYNKNLWTKDANAIAYLTSQIGNRLAFLCNVSHWTNQSGQPIRSLWIDQVGSPAVGSPAMAGPPQQPQGAPPPQQAPQPAWNQPAQPQPQQSAVVQPVVTPMVAATPQGDLREQKIHRQTAAKVAAILLGYLPEAERTLSTLLIVSERLVAYFDTGMTQAETLDDLMQRAMPSSIDAVHPGDPVMEPPPHTDDDIPF